MTPDHTPGDGELLAEATQTLAEWDRYDPDASHGTIVTQANDLAEALRSLLAAWSRRAPTTPGEKGSSNASLRPTPKSADTEAEPSAVWKLGAADSETFVRALSEPAEPNDALLEAAARYRASRGMTVADLRTLLADQPDAARVLVFDHFTDERTTTIGANCILSMDHGGPVAIICNQDEG